MKNSSFFSLMAAAMGAGMSANAPNLAVHAPDIRGYRPGRYAKGHGRVRPSGTKFRAKYGRIGLTHPTVGLSPDGIKISPKKDIGKGPAWTMPVRGYSTARQERIMAKTMRRQLKAQGL